MKKLQTLWAAEQRVNTLEEGLVFFVISGDIKFEVVVDGPSISRLKITAPQYHVKLNFGTLRKRGEVLIFPPCPLTNNI